MLSQFLPAYLSIFGYRMRIRNGNYEFFNPQNQQVPQTQVQPLIDTFNPLPEERAFAKERIIQEIDEEFSDLDALYPLIERLRFSQQEIEYDAWSANPGAATPTIDKIAIERGVDREIQIQKVGEKIINFRNRANHAAGKRQRLFDQVDSETDWKKLQSISYKDA